MKKYPLFLIILFCFIVSAQAQIDKEFAGLFDPEFTAEEPGGSILVKKGKKVLFQKSYGLSDVQNKEKITENTIFNTGSISKTVVAYGILILEAQGKLSLDDNLEKYFPDFANKTIAKNTKIKHLLTHTSGLPDVRKVQSRRQFYITAKDRENFEPIKQADKLNFASGERFEYSNPAFNGLALIIEKITQQPWQQFIQEKIFIPANMMQSKITNGAYPQEGVAHAYITKNQQFIENDYGEVPTFAAAGNGGVWCSVLDLAKYEKAIQEAIFLNEASIAKSRQAFYPTNWKDKRNLPGIGYSWFILEKGNKRNTLGVHRVSHTGSQGGFRSFYISIPEKELLFVALFNRPIPNMKALMDKGMAILKAHDWLD